MIRHFFSNSFLQRSSIIMIGNLAGQILTILLLPAVTRLYGTEQIGYAATSLAIFTLFGFVVNLQYDNAIIISDEQDAIYLIILACAISMSIGIFYFLVLISVNFFDAEKLALLKTWGWNGYLGILILIYGVFNVFLNFQLRINNIKLVGLARLVYYGGTPLLQVGGGLLLGGSYEIYLAGQILACMSATLCLVSSTFTYLRHSRISITWRELGTTFHNITEVQKKYSNFPRYQMGARLLNGASVQIPILILRFFFSETWAAWYFMAYRILASPTSLIAQAVGQIFYRDSAELEREGIIQNALLRQVVERLFVIAAFVGIIGAVAAPSVILFLLGNEWQTVGQIIQIEMIPFIAYFCTSPVSNILNVKNLQRQALLFNALLFSARTGAFLFAAFWFNPWLGEWISAITSALIYLALLNYIFKITTNYTLINYLLFFPLSSNKHASQ